MGLIVFTMILYNVYRQKSQFHLKKCHFQLQFYVLWGQKLELLFAENCCNFRKLSFKIQSVIRKGGRILDGLLQIVKNRNHHFSKKPFFIFQQNQSTQRSGNSPFSNRQINHKENFFAVISSIFNQCAILKIFSKNQWKSASFQGCKTRKLGQFISTSKRQKLFFRGHDTAKKVETFVSIVASCSF